MYFNYNQCYINVFQMNGWINGLTVYNVHVMFEISAKTIYMKEIIALKPMNVFKNYHSVVAYRPGVCESVSNGIAQNKKCTVILINSE